MKFEGRNTATPGYLHFVFEAHGGTHDIGSPTADFKCEEVVWAELAEPTLGLRDPWEGNAAFSQGRHLGRGLVLTRWGRY